MQWAVSFHLFATLVFVVGSAVVGLRLVWLAHRTRELPELLLGGAILASAVLGYGVLIAAMIVRGGVMAADPESVPGLAVALSATGKIVHNLGVTCFFFFLLQVFRRDDRWARALTGFAMLLLWGGLVWGAANGAFRVERVGSPAWLCEYLVIWTYPIWLAVESFRYWAMMRRRQALGFADPLVTNRFALWGIGSVCTGLAIWSASVPFFLIDDLALSRRVEPLVHIVTAAAGLASVSCSYLAFLPPAWYARRISAQMQSGAPLQP
jgi:hypothetical protein